MAVKSKKNNQDFGKIAPYLIIGIPFLVYIISVRFGLTYFDDDMLIIDNYSKLSKLSGIFTAFRSDAFFANMSPYYRPMMNVSFVIDTLIGQGNIGVYHFFNLFYHILASWLLYRFLQLLNFGTPLSLATTLIYSIHPVMGQAVLWIPARGDLLVTIFSLSAFISLIKYLDSGKMHYILLNLLAFAGAIFSKESAIVLPVLLFMLLLFRKEKIFETKKILLYTSWIITGIGWYYLRHITIDNRPDAQRGIDAIISNLPFVPESVERLTLPFDLPVTPVFSTLITLLGLICIAGLLFLFIKKRKSIDTPLLLFGLLWFLLFSAPNMFVRLASANDNFEYLNHRLYLPSIGFIIIILSMIPKAIELWNNSTNRAIFTGVYIILTILSIFQQPKYASATSFWDASTSYAPDRSWFYYYYGRYYFKQKDFKMYEKFLLKADSIKSYPNFHYQLAMVYFSEYKDYDKAFRYFNSAFSSKGYGDEEARKNFILFCIESSNALALDGKTDEAISRCQLALDNDPENEVAAYNLGLYVIAKGEKERAVSLWRRALNIKPAFAEPYKSLAIYYLYDRNLSDSALVYAKKYKEAGGNEDLLKMIYSKK